MNELKSLLLQAPDSQLDASMKTIIQNWSSPPKSLEILEVLDKVIHGSLGSGFTVKVLDMVLNKALALENQSLDDIVEKAIWRKSL